jgi:hypothetical protein
MSRKKCQQERVFEIALILLCLGLCCLMHRVGSYRMVVLHLFYLPVALAAFFLGRYRAGVLALLCVTCAAVVMALDLGTAVAYNSPLVIGLALTIWGAALGLSAILVGTLSDERTHKIGELHDAYVGVVEVLSRYLNSADPKLKDRATMISELSQEVAARMRLSEKEIDDIRVAALLQDIEHIEVTARVIRKAVGDLADSGAGSACEHTFNGSDLVHSLGSVLTGALPLLLDQDVSFGLAAEDGLGAPANSSLGTKIIRIVKSYVDLLYHDAGTTTPQDAIDLQMADTEDDHNPAVIHALEQVVLRSPKADSRRDSREPVAAGNGRY